MDASEIKMNKPDRFKLIASLYLILIRDDKVLLMRRKHTGFEDGNYGLPSGHLEKNETLTEGLAREAKEEIGIDILPSDLQLVEVMHRKHEDIRMDFFFVTNKYHNEPTNCEPEKCDDLQWFPLNNLPPNTIQYIRLAIENYRKNITYSEVGW